MSKKQNKIKGNFGENIACNYLKDEKYEIIARNFNCLYGEIDIIATKNDEIIFIEVKTRCQTNFGQPIEAVDAYKKYHIYNASKYFLYKYNILDTSIRFDIIEVYLEEHECFRYSLSHIKNIIIDAPKKRRKI